MRATDTSGIEVLLFSVLKERVGQSKLHLEVKAPIRASALLDLLAERYPAVAPYRSVVRLAVNHVYVPDHAEVHPGDEVALITPVSGG